MLNYLTIENPVSVLVPWKAINEMYIASHNVTKSLCLKPSMLVNSVCVQFRVCVCVCLNHIIYTRTYKTTTYSGNI